MYLFLTLVWYITRFNTAKINFETSGFTSSPLVGQCRMVSVCKICFSVAKRLIFQDYV